MCLGWVEWVVAINGLADSIRPPRFPLTTKNLSHHTPCRSEVDPWNHLAVQLNRTSADQRGDPDLYGLFLSPGTDGPDLARPRWDFQDTSSGAKGVEAVHVSRAEYDPDRGAKIDGLLLCVHAYGGVNVTTSLRARRDVCPTSFDALDGVATVCSTRVDAPAGNKRYEACSPEGRCLCTGAYRAPLPEIYPGAHG